MKKRQFVSILLVLYMVLSFLPVNAFAASGNEEPVIVIAGSDFQNTDNDHDAGAAQVVSILDQIQAAGYTTADGFLFAGDYDYGYDDPAKGKATLQATVLEEFPTMSSDNMVWVEGNHDSKNFDLVSSGTLSSSGANDKDAYGVYVIHESDYMWYNDDEDTIKNTAAALSDYLDAKVAENYDKPIFVVSHLPLHYNMRTYNDGDGMYANYIFDELNAAGAEGLNIIFLFGHNHSNGWDDYLGGSAIYLEKGDSINIAQASKTAFDVETLNFTYMNAGYVAYYRNENTGSECDLTMTVFEITDGNVTVKRYSENDVHELKSNGVRNSYKSETAYNPDTTVYTSPQTITWAANATVTDPTTGVSVTAPGLTGVTVTKPSVTVPNGYTAYITYDIAPAGYVQGSRATVTVPVDSTFDPAKPVMVIDQEKQTTSAAAIVNGTVTFITNHFSAYSVAQADSGVTASGTLQAATVEQIMSMKELEENVGYLIVADEGDDITLTNQSNDGGLLLAGSVSADNANLWYLDLENEYIRYGSNSGTNNYLKVTNGGASVGNSNNRVTEIADNGDGTFALYRSGNYLNRYGGADSTKAAGYTSNNSGSKWKFYKITTGTDSPVSLTVTPGSAALQPSKTANLTPVILVDGAVSNNYTLIWASDNEDIATVNNGVVTGVADGIANITATLTRANEQAVSGNGITVTIPVTVTTKAANDITVEPMTGSVERGSKVTATTGSKMTVTYDDGSTETIDVTVNMLSGTYDLTKNGAYQNLTVTFAGKTVEGYTLNVVNVSGNDFPTYPNGGSVNVSKTGTGLDFQNTGLAQIQLSTSGLPTTKGVDVIIMVDTSSSMNYCQHGSQTPSAHGCYSDSRIEILKDSLTNLLNQLMAKNTDGSDPDVRVAIADFNGYNSIDPSSDYVGANTTTNNTDKSGIYTGPHANLRLQGDDDTPQLRTYTEDELFNADAFVDITSLSGEVDTTVGYLDVKSGTNYDAAFDNIYRLGKAITEKNEANGEDRELYVIFMSDGAPFSYNQYQSKSAQSEWNDWLQGTYETYTGGSHPYFYNGEGNKHRMAEAIKGDTNTNYTVITADPSAYLDGNQYMTTVKGLGATMYSIGFCLVTDKQITTDSMEYVLKEISSDSSKYYYSTTDASTLTGAFSEIGSQIRYAAQNAVFEDQMGSAFDLQMNPTVMDSSGNTRTVDTDITITTHPIYTSAQIGEKVNGYTVTADDVGKTYGEGTVVEKVSFTVGEEGNIAAASTAVTETDGNILNDGVICAKNFFYNTTASAKTITLADGSTYSLPAETFYWNIGTINEKQFTLSYTVYLTGSMEGETVPDDSYDTNNYAKLSYTNWLGNEVSQSVPSPSMPWGGANVSYAFYLVDSNGNPLLADGTSADNFLQAYKVTQPVLYKTINLNSDETVLSAVAKEVLPTGYTLYDESAVYTVQVNSGDGGGSWTIDYDTSKTQSTYVVGYGSSNDYSKDIFVNEGSYDYTHTTVYFAVVWTVGTVPDAVVIDYGLPVDISVLVNDMFGGNATLAGVGKLENKPKAAYTTTLDSDFGSSVATTYGTANANGDKVRYTLDTSNGMQVAAAETFAYAANYTGATNPGYYYGEVTVIPATTVYYEENFITFKDSSAATDTHGKWSDAGTRDTNATQDEDRPGEYSLGSIDANNVYGYDSAYTSCTTFSNGGAKKVTVNTATGTKAAAPTATFTFTGTGFDVISLTNNQSGAIMVTATNAADGTVYKKTVDDYYGYSYGEYTNEAGETVTGWYVDTESTDTIWQVPVIKMEGMPYGTYNVEIKVTFLNLADHDDDGSYSFWMDAIRIYDPAKNDTTSNQAYDEDKEYAPVYMTLRDLLVGAGDLATDAEKATGVVFIDGKDATSDIHDYANPGPNNETYLAQGQGVSFKLGSTTKPVSAQIGVKLAYGDKATLKLGESDFQTVETASDMYYEMALTWKQNESGTYESNVIVLSNATANAVISLTNIKLTYDAPASGVQPTAVVDEEVLTAAPMMMRMLYAPVVEEKPDPFVAEYVDATWVGTRAKRTSILSITTSEDVEAVTVNGEEIGTYVTVPKISFENWKLTVAYYRLWIYTDKQATAGIYTYDVIVYNADGLASESIAAELTVR